MSEEHMPDQHMTELELFIGKAGDPVPIVDPEDLKRLWKYGQDLRAKYPNGGVATGIEVLKHLCSPGADTRAASYRCAMLALLSQARGNVGGKCGDTDGTFTGFVERSG